MVKYLPVQQRERHRPIKWRKARKENVKHSKNYYNLFYSYFKGWE